MSVEFDLLRLVTAPTYNTSAQTIRDRLNSTNTDWSQAMQSAQDQGLLPLFAQRLLTEFADCLPNSIRIALELLLEQHRDKTAALTRALTELLRQFDRANLIAIPFKGPVLAERAFGNTGLRLFADLDILFPEAQVDQAVQILIRNGYQHHSDLNSAQIAAIRRYGGQYMLFNPSTSICVEPHWAFAPSTLAIDLDYSVWFEHARRTTFLGQSCFRLVPEHEVLMLCIHAGKERWSTLKPVVDLAGFVNQHPALNWHQLLEESQRWGILRMLLLGVQLIHELLNTEIPVVCKSKIVADPTVNKLAIRIIKALADQQTAILNPYQIDRYRLALRERQSDKCRYIIRTITTPRAQHYRIVALPDSLRWLYLPIKLIFDYLLTPLSRWLKTNFSKPQQ